MKIKINRIAEGAEIKLPARAHYNDAGADVYTTFGELPPIDSGYTGEVHAIVTNLTDKLKKVPGGTRIGQLVVMPIVLADFVEQLGEERGDGAFGSTGEA